MKIDLKEVNVFSDEKIDFNKKISIIYGRNGTGKSTLSKLIENHSDSKEKHLFQGFESVIGENQKLNAVILGEKNIEINNEIKKIEEKISNIEKIYDNENKKIISDGTYKGEIFLEKEEKEKVIEKERSLFQKFSTKSAATIKRMDNPRISDVSYDTRNFSAEYTSAKRIEESVLKEQNEILLTKIRIAKNVVFPKNIDFKKYILAVNEILESVVIEKQIIERLDTQEKIIFAEKGLDASKVGENCAFCDNIISEEKYNEISSFFSSDEVKKLESRILEGKKTIQSELSVLDNIKIDITSFYPDLNTDIMEINGNIQKICEEQKSFYLTLIDSLEEKEKSINMRKKMDTIIIGTPKKFSEVENQYNLLLKRNNENDLSKKQEKARKMIRLNFIFNCLEEYEYYKKKGEMSIINEELIKIEIKQQKVEEKCNNMRKEIEEMHKKIQTLQMKGLNEKILAQRINGKLKNTTSFVLEHVENEEQGFYQIRCLITNEERPITKLSTGEKNIIAFLYFIEKLEEKKREQEYSHVFIFDDPMNSNDENMQYKILTELIELARTLQAEDKLIILTHNKHFYLNIRHDMYFDSKTKNSITLFRLLSNNLRTTIEEINPSEDFKTSYEELWEEFIFIYKNEDCNESMLLNPLRRIIETFIKFNNFSITGFYDKKLEAKKLFNVNSHSIDDVEAELNGKSKYEILMLAKKCFDENGGENHFSKYSEDIIGTPN